VSTILDLLGIALLAACAWFVWAPLPLAVVGVAALVASRQMVRVSE
jgi:hypothetical protein